MKTALVTAGSTRTPIDLVRAITNIFKGRTGAAIAWELANNGYKVTLMTSNRFVVRRHRNITIVDYTTYDELLAKMEEIVRNTKFDLIVHSSAVSDYKSAGLYYKSETDELVQIDTSGKAPSTYPELWLRLVQTQKIVDLIRDEWGFTGTLVKFKLQVKMSDEELLSVATKSMHASKADFIVANCLEWFGKKAYIIDAKDDSYAMVSRRSLAKELRRGVES